jgi:hypothetical protein
MHPPNSRNSRPIDELAKLSNLQKEVDNKQWLFDQSNTLLLTILCSGGFGSDDQLQECKIHENELHEALNRYQEQLNFCRTYGYC